MKEDKLTLKINHKQAFVLLKSMELNAPICKTIEELMLLQEPAKRLRAKMLGFSYNITQTTIDLGQVAVLAILFRSPALENEAFVIDIKLAVNEFIAQKYLKPMVRPAHQPKQTL